LVVAPRYFDAQLRFDYRLGTRDVITASLFGADDKMRLALESEPSFDESPDGFRFDTTFWRLGVTWQRVVDDAVIRVTPWLGIDQSELKVGEQGSSRDDLPAGLRANVAVDFDSGSSNTGLDVQVRRSALFLRNEPPPMPGAALPAEMMVDSRESFADLGFYQDLTWTPPFARWLTAKPGFRIDRFGLADEWTFDPRISLRETLDEQIQMTQSLGIYHQGPALPDKNWGSPAMRTSRAVQGDIGMRWKPSDKGAFSATAFGSSSDRLPVDVVSSASPVSAGGSLQSGGVGAISGVLLEEQFGTWSYREAVGRGRAYGLELMGQLRTESFFGWLAYTWSRSERTGDPASDATYYSYLLDQPNVLTALGSWKIGKWRLGGRFRYATGNPYTPVAGAYFDSDSQSYVPRDGALLSARMPNYMQLDLRIDRLWQLSFGRLSAFLDLQNATNRLNPEGVSYSSDYSEVRYTRGLPIFPSIGLEFVQ
jgi:hypothetical protein